MLTAFRMIMKKAFCAATVTALIVFSLSMVGLGHRAGYSIADAERVAFAQFWGQPDPELCGSFGKGEAGKSSDCPACHLLAGMALPPAPVDAAPVVFTSSMAAPRLAKAEGTMRPNDPALWVRGPPLDMA